MKKLSYIGFDLDGTLIDSHHAIYECLKFTIPKYSNVDIDKIIDIVFPLTLDQFPDYINFSSDNDFLEFKSFFISSFDKIYYKKVKVLKGTEKTLEYCVNKFGSKNVFILTNRRNESAVQICNYLGISNIIPKENIFSSVNDGTRNPKATSLSNIILSNYKNSLEGCYIGDSSVDIESAILNKINPIYISKKPIESIVSVFHLKIGYNLFNYIEDIKNIL
tara:strand:- start:78 stop:737 length:660 start_codon:yes stop_codon:yes gene_type:complete